MSGSWIIDSNLVVLHLKFHFDFSIQAIDLSPAKYCIVTTIAIKWHTLRVQYYFQITSTSYIYVGLPIADSLSILLRICVVF